VALAYLVEDWTIDAEAQYTMSRYQKGYVAVGLVVVPRVVPLAEVGADGLVPGGVCVVVTWLAPGLGGEDVAGALGLESDAVEEDVVDVSGWVVRGAVVLQ
jgi:hypothetical protein